MCRGPPRITGDTDMRMRSRTAAGARSDSGTSNESNSVSDSPPSVVTVIPTSTVARPSIHRPELQIAGSATRMLVDQVRSIDVDYVVGDPVDYLTRDQLAEVEVALAHYLGIQEAIPPPTL